MIADDYRDPLPIRIAIVYTWQDCVGGTCDCDLHATPPRHCKFAHCPNCEGIINALGTAFEQDLTQPYCPFCFGPR